MVICHFYSLFTQHCVCYLHIWAGLAGFVDVKALPAMDAASKAANGGWRTLMTVLPLWLVTMVWAVGITTTVIPHMALPSGAHKTANVSDNNNRDGKSANVPTATRSNW